MTTPEQIGIDPVRRMASAGSRRLVDGLQTHQAHQAPYPVTPHADTFAAQMTDHLAAAVERVRHEQLVETAHQRPVVLTLSLGLVIQRGATHSPQAALSAQAELGMAGMNCPPFRPDHLA